MFLLFDYEYAFNRPRAFQPALEKYVLDQQGKADL